MKSMHAGSTASRVLDVIAAQSAWINTSEISAQLRELEPQQVSSACYDLLLAKKVVRDKVNNRYVYKAYQGEMFAGAAVPDVRKPASKQVARRMSGRQSAAAGVSTTLKLRTLDRLIALLADDVAAVLKAVRNDVAGASS